MIFHIPWIYVPVRNVLAIWHQLTKYEIPELTKPSVIMRDRGRVEEIIRNMHRAGPGALQVISDFDMMLTRFAYNGKLCPTSYGILENSSLISKHCKAKCVDVCRDGYEVFFGSLKDHSIPLLIFSAGLGDILEEVIKLNGLFHPNIRVFSNYMGFDKNVEERRDAYVGSYDIVLEKDEMLDVPNAILNYITEGKRSFILLTS
ncbi:7-methylguanosine phosphate-specific 5'-nucleotidase-like [Colossoma macropomum]|uniref:7-methylguanosine phosphate-specific 5'-nucleotidase-like n=1 Tax=Colossoma macropomum TaxID=42526 RepID=UPI001864158F|nr:7-methylguanosine phosphate-specific 5'-nucleotidase-like [Colossoma macropomum]